MITLSDLQNRLKKIDEVSLLEVLNITSEDLVDRFVDFIEENYDKLKEDFEEPQDQSPDRGREYSWEDSVSHS